jgi:hypothetical protein
VVAEQAVRRYLAALRDPSALRDESALKALREKLDSTADPVERVQLQEQLRRATQPDLAAVEQDFVTAAKGWADDRGISAEAFRAEGVALSTLRAAGFDVRGGGARPRKGQRRRSTRTRVPAEQIRKAIPRGQFTISEIAVATGASTATVRKVVTELLEAGELTEVGPAKRRSGPGRAPKAYRRKGRARTTRA